MVSSPIVLMAGFEVITVSTVVTPDPEKLAAATGTRNRTESVASRVEMRRRLHHPPTPDRAQACSERFAASAGREVERACHGSTDQRGAAKEKFAAVAH